MKTLTLLFAAALLLVPSLSRADGPVFDTTVNQTLKTNLEPMNLNIGKILTDADNQLAELKKLTDAATGMPALTSAVQEQTTQIKNLVRVIGDPSLVTSSNNGVSAVKKDLTDSQGGLKRLSADSNGVLDVQSPAVSINNVFNETGGGNFTPIGGTFVSDTKTGATQARGTSTGADVPPTDYKLEASQIAAVNDYFRVRDLALTRRDALQSVLSDALDQLKNAQTFADVEKINAVIQALQSQLQACSDDINNSYNDTAVRGMQAYVLGSLKTKADGEPRVAAMNQKLQAAMDASKTHPTPPAAPPATGSYDAAAGSATGTYLPWVVYK